MSSRALVELGKKLVAELDFDDSVDTLGRWMAHYIAELLLASDADGDVTAAKNVELRDAILALWAHRSELPSGMRPFSEFEPILNALASLDLESQLPRYFSPELVSLDPSVAPEESGVWLKAAKDFDYASKALISYCLTQAAGSAIDKSQEWVGLAERAGIDNTTEFRIIRIIAEEKGLLDEEQDSSDEQKRILLDRKEKLDLFLSSAALLTDDINNKLNDLEPENKE